MHTDFIAFTNDDRDRHAAANASSHGCKSVLCEMAAAMNSHSLKLICWSLLARTAWP